MAVSAKPVVSGRRKGKGIIFAFLAPAILIYAIFFLYPAFNAFQISLYDWSGFSFSSARFVGLANFKEALADKWVRLAFANNLIIMVVGGIFMFSLALFFAWVLTNRRYKGRTFFKTAIFLPHVINDVGVALLWVFIFQPRFGMLNQLLRSVGLSNLATVWLGSHETAIPSIIFVFVWYVIGFYMVLLIAGIEGIPTDLYDAARIDGASDWQVFRSVVLPLLRDVLAIAVIYWMIGALNLRPRVGNDQGPAGQPDAYRGDLHDDLGLAFANSDLSHGLRDGDLGAVVRGGVYRLVAFLPPAPLRGDRVFKEVGR